MMVHFVSFLSLFLDAIGSLSFLHTDADSHLRMDLFFFFMLQS